MASSGTTPLKITLPNWMADYPPVIEMIKMIGNQGVHRWEEPILARLATDPRMKVVWVELSRRNRATGEFFHPAISSEGAPRLSPESVQAVALAETFYFAFSLMARGRVASKTEGEIIKKKDELQLKAQFLHEIAADLPVEKDHLLRIAGHYEDALKKIRGFDDPLTVKKHRGDPIQRGLQTLLAEHLLEKYGNHLNGTAATLTEVGMGLKEGNTSPQVSRSAHKAKKRLQKTEC